ncbi:hypothetical protein GCM10010361_67120 [Streptomyces olivaceiscleroticus]|uniref:Uncharacterized protein n=1 Tax=Streptomyces olivaceiscleroticus TaxID=68245 RepID=A0ABN1B8W7_9ACTN
MDGKATIDSVDGEATIDGERCSGVDAGRARTWLRRGLRTPAFAARLLRPADPARHCRARVTFCIEILFRSKNCLRPAAGVDRTGERVPKECEVRIPECGVLSATCGVRCRRVVIPRRCRPIP